MAENSSPTPSNVKDQAVDQAASLKDTAVEHAGALTSEAKDKASNVLHDVRRDLETQGESQTQRLATSLHDTGRQLRDMADGADPGNVTTMTRQLADGVERAASRLEQGGLQGFGDDLRQFARRQPGLFLAGAALAGFMVTRMLRSSGMASSSGPSMGSSPQPSTAALPSSTVPELGRPDPVLATGPTP
jgi:hypothetical protein